MERHYVRVVTASRIHAQKNERATEKFLSGYADVQRRSARCLCGYAKPGGGLGTSSLGPGSRKAVVRKGLPKHYVQIESREYMSNYNIMTSYKHLPHDCKNPQHIIGSLRVNVRGSLRTNYSSYSACR